jgi:hypothetical protein
MFDTAHKDWRHSQHCSIPHIRSGTIETAFTAVRLLWHKAAPQALHC